MPIPPSSRNSKSRDEKKLIIIGPVRLGEQQGKQYGKALDYFSLTNAGFARLCIQWLIERYYARDRIEIPLNSTSLKRWLEAFQKH